VYIKVSSCGPSKNGSRPLWETWPQVENQTGRLKLKASFTVSKVLWTLIQKKLEPHIIHNWNFRRRHTCYAEDEFAELLNDKSLQPEFSKQSLCQFWIRTRNECPDISDLVVHKPLAFCTTYLCEAAFLKWIIDTDPFVGAPLLPMYTNHLPNCVAFLICFWWQQLAAEHSLKFASCCDGVEVNALAQGVLRPIHSVAVDRTPDLPIGRWALHHWTTTV